jgi:predicted DNA-binding transcriptional regulator AlpA
MTTGSPQADRLLTIDEAAEWLRVSRLSVYNLIRNSEPSSSGTEGL